MSSKVLLFLGFHEVGDNAFKITWEFKKQDLWLGLYWNSKSERDYILTDYWLCLIPMFPIHLRIWIKR